MTTIMWVWLGVMIVSIVIELCTMEVVSIWFTFGAVLPFVLEVIGVGLEWQLVAFVFVSAILIASLRKVTKRFLLRNSEGKTNLEAIIGQKYKLIEPITEDAKGTIKINGVIWSVLSETSKTINAGELVEVVKVSGNKIIVK